MKKITILLFSSLFALSFVLTSCGGGAAGDEASADSTKKADSPVEPEKPKFEVPAEMTEFMSMLTGKSDNTEAALTKFGVEDLETADMEMYDLKDAKAVGMNNKCFTMEAASGQTIRTYDICWDNGKITTVVDKGMR
jgi:hypothetical protein